MRQIHIRALKVHALRDGVAVTRDVGTEDADRARTRPDQTEEHGDGRRLAGAVAAEQRDSGPRLNCEIEMIDGGHGSKPLG